MRGLLGRARASRVMQGSAWILIGLGTQAALGFAFWLLASRVATSAELGRASALFTAINFVNYASGLGLTVAMARFASTRSSEADALFGWAIVATVASSVICGASYLALVHTEATDMVTGGAAGWVLFCAYAAGTAVGLLVDVRLMAARRWGWLVGRLAVIGLVRLPLVPLDVSVPPDVWLYTLMLAPLALGGVLSVPLLPAIGAGGVSLRRPHQIGTVARYAGVNWFATLSSQAPQLVLPLVVAQSVPPGINASFFLAWTVTGLVFLAPAAISQVLLVEGSKEALEGTDGGAPSGSREREALAFSLLLASVAWVGSLAVGPVLAAVFGDGYARLGRLLPSLMLAGIPWAYTSVRLAEARIRRDQRATVAITATLGLAILVPVLVFVPDHGTLAATRAWLFGNLAGAIVALLVHRPHARRRATTEPVPVP